MEEEEPALTPDLCVCAVCERQVGSPAAVSNRLPVATAPPVTIARACASASRRLKDRRLATPLAGDGL